MRRRLGTVRTVHRDAGAGGVAYLLVRRLRIPRLRLEWFALYEHSRPPDPDATFRWAERGDLRTLAEFDHDEAVVGGRMERGHRCAIVERDRAVAGWVWIAVGGTYDEADLIFHLGASDAWAYDGLVDPALRGRGISPRLRRSVAAELREQGVERVLSTVDRLNTASLRAAGRSGRQVAWFLQIHLGSRGVVRIAPIGRGARWHGYTRTLDVRVPPGL